MYCMPKRYADSVDTDLRKFDQLKKKSKAQTYELNYAYKYIDNLHGQVAELDSLNTTNVEYYEGKIETKNKKLLGGGAIIIILTVLLCL
jgi:hypothetical protein